MREVLAKAPLPRTRRLAPTCIGSGFVALDWICLEKQAKPSQTLAGGSCGNVLSILAYLGWKSVPLARLKNDSPAKILLRDLEEWKVVTDFVTKDAKGSTPVVIQRILKGEDGIPFHKFEWRFPNTGERLPSYRPLPKKLAAEYLPQLPTANFFYMDRADPSTVLLAKALREKGTIIFFEPSGIRDARLFSECLAVSDIVKYSHERLDKIPASASPNRPILEIRTLGNRGLEYRLKSKDQPRLPWRFMPAYSVGDLKDTCGAGDWCSAGMIHYIQQHHLEALAELSSVQAEAAIRYGQALAAINCQFEGARGAMYKYKNRSEIVDQVDAVQFA
jgi:fructokinase